MLSFRHPQALFHFSSDATGGSLPSTTEHPALTRIRARVQALEEPREQDPTSKRKQTLDQWLLSLLADSAFSSSYLRKCAESAKAHASTAEVVALRVIGPEIQNDTNLLVTDSSRIKMYVHFKSGRSALYQIPGSEFCSWLRLDPDSDEIKGKTTAQVLRSFPHCLMALQHGPQQFERLPRSEVLDFQRRILHDLARARDNNRFTSLSGPVVKETDTADRSRLHNPEICLLEQVLELAEEGNPILLAALGTTKHVVSIGGAQVVQRQADGTYTYVILEKGSFTLKIAEERPVGIEEFVKYGLHGIFDFCSEMGIPLIGEQEQQVAAFFAIAQARRSLCAATPPLCGKHWAHRALLSLYPLTAIEVAAGKSRAGVACLAGNKIAFCPDELSQPTEIFAGPEGLTADSFLKMGSLLVSRLLPSQAQTVIPGPDAQETPPADSEKQRKLWYRAVRQALH